MKDEIFEKNEKILKIEKKISEVEDEKERADNLVGQMKEYLQAVGIDIEEIE